MIFLIPQAHKFHMVSLAPHQARTGSHEPGAQGDIEARFKSSLCHLLASVTTERYLASPSLSVFISKMQIITGLQGSTD